jgi:nucleoside-diphosphate-sugar epimerase
MLTTPTTSGLLDMSNIEAHTATMRVRVGMRSTPRFLHPTTVAAESGMRVLVTGSSGHLGEALVRTLLARGADVVSIDSRPSPFTSVVGSVTDPDLMREVMAGVEVVFHMAAVHKPQIAFVPRQAFLDTNIVGTQTVLDAAVVANVRAFVMTSSTTVFGDALIPPADQPAAWIDESVTPVPKNIYGVTKASAEDLCQLAHRNDGLACVVLRASRFFVEGDDMPHLYDGRSEDNIKANEYACRRVALEDVVDAHLKAGQRAPQLGFGRYVVSATTPFTRADMAELRTDAAAVFARRVPLAAGLWKERGWRFPDTLDRVYINARARQDLGWRPRFDLNAIAARLSSGESVHTPLSQLVGSREYANSQYHLGVFHPEGDTVGVAAQHVHRPLAAAGARS